MKFPITSYKEDPETHRLAEYHEVSYGVDAKQGGYLLLDMHGWWEHQSGKDYLNREVLSEPHKSEIDADHAVDSHVQWLESQGWTFKFTTAFNSKTGMLEPLRL